MKPLGLTICCILALGMACFARSNYAVLVEESPVGAGEIKPGPGVHTFSVNETVTLTTVAKAGWHFIYWLGDVSDPTANCTMLAVDGPKIVIAVFEWDKYELPGDSAAVSSGPENLIRRVDIIGGSGGGGGGGGKSDDSATSSPSPELPSSPPPEPSPEPVPEPHTLIIMAAGAYIGCKKRFFGIPRINQHHRHRGPGPRNP